MTQLAVQPVALDPETETLVTTYSRDFDFGALEPAEAAYFDSYGSLPHLARDLDFVQMAPFVDPENNFGGLRLRDEEGASRYDEPYRIIRNVYERDLILPFSDGERDFVLDAFVGRAYYDLEPEDYHHRADCFEELLHSTTDGELTGIMVDVESMARRVSNASMMISWHSLMALCPYSPDGRAERSEFDQANLVRRVELLMEGSAIGPLLQSVTDARPPLDYPDALDTLMRSVDVYSHDVSRLEDRFRNPAHSIVHQLNELHLFGEGVRGQVRGYVERLRTH